MGDLPGELAQQAMPFGHGLFAASDNLLGAEILTLGFFIGLIGHGLAQSCLNATTDSPEIHAPGIDRRILP